MNKDITIMIVDDALVMRRLMRQYLLDMGFSRIIEAEDGRVAVGKLAEEEPVDMVISDWLMPNLDGLGFLKVLRSTEAGASTPFLMVTLLDQREQVLEAVQQGVDDYIVKPLDYESFKGKVFRLLEKSGRVPEKTGDMRD